MYLTLFLKQYFIMLNCVFTCMTVECPLLSFNKSFRLVKISERRKHNNNNNNKVNSW